MGEAGLSNLMEEAGSLSSVIELLLPGVDDPICELAHTVFLDEGQPVRLSAIDQILMALARARIPDQTAKEAVVLLPRCANRTALLLAVGLQVLRLQNSRLLAGPVVLVAADIDLAGQLRHLQVSNHRRMRLANGNPLHAHRLTRGGDVVPVLGSEKVPVNHALIYLNTRVGWPSLRSASPLIVLDATSITSPEGRRRAIEWTQEQEYAALVVVGDLGDSTLLSSIRHAGIVPLVLPVTVQEAKELDYLCGHSDPPSSTLSSMGLMVQPEPKVHLWAAGDGAVNDAINRATTALSAKPPGPMATELDIPIRLLRGGMRLVATYSEYCRACADNPRGGEGPRVLRRLLANKTFHGTGSWQAWGSGRWASLKMGVTALWEAIEESNPKLPILWNVLDELERTTTGAILLRCHSRAAVEATRATLSAETNTELQAQVWAKICDRITIDTYRARYPAHYFQAQVLSGIPQPWLFSVLVGAEAVTSHLIGYSAELETIKHVAAKWCKEIGDWRAGTARHLGALALPAPASPLIEEDLGASEGAHHLLPSVPGLSLSEVLERAALALDEPELDRPVSLPPGEHASAGSWIRCVPVHLEDGRTWYCRSEADNPTLVLAVRPGGEQTVPVTSLQRGSRIVIPAGDGLESVHARLLAASRSNADVASLDLILSMFRAAAKAVIARSHTKVEACQAVAAAGASAYSQLGAWADGTTIAPREPHDVEAVFKAAGTKCPDLGLIYAVANELRELSGALKRFAAAIGSGGGDAAAERLRQIVGPTADEILDEFEVAVVDQLGETRDLPSSLAGRVR